MTLDTRRGAPVARTPGPGSHPARPSVMASSASRRIRALTRQRAIVGKPNEAGIVTRDSHPLGRN